MPIYVKKLDWSKCQGIPTRVNDSVVEEVLNYLFNTNAWKQNPDLLPQKMRKWRERLWSPTNDVRVDGPPPVATEVAVDGDDVTGATDGPTPDQAPDTQADNAGGANDPPHWADVALQMKSQGKSWSQIAKETGKPISTVRDAVRRALEPTAV